MAQGSTKGVPIDTDNTLFLDSDLVVPSQKAIKTYVDNNFQPNSMRKHYYNTSTNVDYLGYAPQGSSTGASVWTVTAITVASNGTTTKTTTTGNTWPY
jgi:hypothetical protein